MSRRSLTDADGIDGPFERAMRRLRRETEPTVRIRTLTDQELADESHERLAVTAPTGGGR